MQSLFRAFLALGATAAFAACSGSGSSGSNPVPYNQYACDGGTQVQLAHPAPNSVGNGNVTSIEIVANGNNNQLYQSYQQYDLLIAPYGGPPTSGYVSNPLSLTSDPSGPKPFTSDFYYTGAIPNGLPYGQSFTVYLNVPNSNCSAVPIGVFST